MKKSPDQFVTQHTVNEILILTFIEPTLCADAINAAAAVIDSTANRMVILDLQSVRCLVSGSLFPDHAPFKPLLFLGKLLSASGRRLILSNIPPEFAEVLRITRLDRVFDIRPILEAVIAAPKTDFAD